VGGGFWWGLGCFLACHGVREGTKVQDKSFPSRMSKRGPRPLSGLVTRPEEFGGKKTAGSIREVSRKKVKNTSRWLGSFQGVDNSLPNMLEGKGDTS